MMNLRKGIVIAGLMLVSVFACQKPDDSDELKEKELTIFNHLWADDLYNYRYIEITTSKDFIFYDIEEDVCYAESYKINSINTIDKWSNNEIVFSRIIDNDWKLETTIRLRNEFELIMVIQGHDDCLNCDTNFTNRYYFSLSNEEICNNPIWD